jgi:ADP-L-glycero-D-manno-heptose 6-epimerase
MGTEKPASGIYNIGTGKARSFNDVAKTIFKILAKPEKISYIDMPNGLNERYQYFTEAKINKLRVVGYKKPFTELEDGILKYINKINDKTS